jgi:hypothetical protein
MSATHTPGLVEERTPVDRFENAIRELGVVAACEWFGHAPDSEFTKDTARVLNERTEASKATGATA